MPLPLTGRRLRARGRTEEALAKVGGKVLRCRRRRPLLLVGPCARYPRRLWTRRSWVLYRREDNSCHELLATSTPSSSSAASPVAWFLGRASPRTPAANRGSATDNAAASRGTLRRCSEAIDQTESGRPPGVVAVLMSIRAAATPTNDTIAILRHPSGKSRQVPLRGLRAGGRVGRAVRRGESRSPRRKTFPIRGVRAAPGIVARVRLPPARRSRRPTDRAALYRIAARSAAERRGCSRVVDSSMSARETPLDVRWRNRAMTGFDVRVRHQGHVPSSSNSMSSTFGVLVSTRATAATRPAAGHVGTGTQANKTSTGWARGTGRCSSCER
jgi:hypothetical protein